jgi:hypothetical protein
MNAMQQTTALANVFPAPAPRPKLGLRYDAARPAQDRAAR